MGQIGKFSIRKGQQKAGRNEGFEENFRKIFRSERVSKKQAGMKVSKKTLGRFSIRKG